MTNPFDYIPLEVIQGDDDPLVYFITAEEVQEFAENNSGGRLTEPEMQELVIVLRETCNYDFLDEAIAQIRPHLRAT